MPILTKEPSTPTKEEKLNLVVNQIRNTSSRSFQDLVRLQATGVRMLWRHPDLTPQEIIDGLGSDAINVFQYHGGLTEYLTQISQIDGIDYIPELPTNSFVINLSAGTITVTEDPYIP